jgi:rubredoxin
MDNTKWVFTQHPEITELTLVSQNPDSDMSCPFCNNKTVFLIDVNNPVLKTRLTCFCSTCEIVYSGVSVDSPLAYKPINLTLHPITAKVWKWFKVEPVPEEMNVINEIPKWNCPYCKAEKNLYVDIVIKNKDSEVDNIGRSYHVQFARFCPSCGTVYDGEYVDAENKEIVK